MDVLGLDGDTEEKELANNSITRRCCSDNLPLGVDGAQIGIFKQADKVRLNGLLKRPNSRRLEAEIRLEVLGDFTHETLEGELADQELGRLLVATNLTEGDGSGLITMGLLDTAGRGRGFAGGLGGELLTGSLASGRFTCDEDASVKCCFWLSDDDKFKGGSEAAARCQGQYCDGEVDMNLRAVCLVRAIADD